MKIKIWFLIIALIGATVEVIWPIGKYWPIGFIIYYIVSATIDGLAYTIAFFFIGLVKKDLGYNGESMSCGHWLIRFVLNIIFFAIFIIAIRPDITSLLSSFGL